GDGCLALALPVEFRDGGQELHLAPEHLLEPVLVLALEPLRLADVVVVGAEQAGRHLPRVPTKNVRRFLRPFLTALLPGATARPHPLPGLLPELGERPYRHAGALGAAEFPVRQAGGEVADQWAALLRLGGGQLEAQFLGRPEVVAVHEGLPLEEHDGAKGAG